MISFSFKCFPVRLPRVYVACRVLGRTELKFPIDWKSSLRRCSPIEWKNSGRSRWRCQREDKNDSAGIFALPGTIGNHRESSAPSPFRQIQREFSGDVTMAVANNYSGAFSLPADLFPSGDGTPAPSLFPVVDFLQISFLLSPMPSNSWCDGSNK
ncbi:hypothetical protein L1887_04370 [Cichorium endivia]|nr:hypothetical protein L1887_04370 [Cichorium endivia]